MHDDLLDLEDISGKRGITTRLAGRVTVREGHAAAALEVMSRFAADPRWLVYLPPTMSPPDTSREPGLLERLRAAAGAAATVALDRTVQLLAQAGARGVEVGPVLTRTRARADMAGQFVEAYRPLRQDSCRVLVFESRRG